LVAAPTRAELPRVYLDTRYQAPTGRTISVAAGGDLQAALDSAQYGDLISLQPGATFVGNFRLKPKAGNGRVTIRTNTTLPAEGERMTPAKAVNLAKLMSPNTDPALMTEGTASGYRIVGLEVGMLPTVTFGYAIVMTGAATENSVDLLPTDIVLDRMYVHGHANSDISRCILLNSASSAVIDSYVSECHGIGRDAQAILSWNSPGPFKIANNFLEGSGENIMFGGAQTRIANLVPSDIEIRGNHIYKPMEWQASGKWSVKNLFELKAGRRVLLDGNVLENCWVHGQVGFAVVMYSTDEGNTPWNIVSDVTLTNNIIRNSAGGVNVAAGMATAQAARRFTFVNNSFEGIGAVSLGWNGRMFQVLNNVDDVTVAHNTFTFATRDGGHSAVAQDGVNLSRFSYKDNVTQGLMLTGGASGGNHGIVGFNVVMTDWSVLGNVVVMPETWYVDLYPTGNAYPPSVDAVGFRNWSAGDFRLGTLSPYKGKATDGRDPGVDYELLLARTSGAAHR
jgi:hypothetical protein